MFNPMPELLLFMACKDFNCLPNAGGWYDQSPEVCESFMIIQNAVNEEKNAEIEKQNRKNKRKYGR